MILSAKEFLYLRTSGDPEKYDRAASEEAPDSVWHEIIELHPSMRCWVAHNKTVPIPILAILATDEHEAVRSAVAQKRKLTPDLFEALSLDPSPGVRERIAYNAKAPLAVLRRLASDPDEIVSNAALRRLG